MSDSLRRRLGKLERTHRDNQQHHGGAADEHERQLRQARLREHAEHSNKRARREGTEPLFEITEDGDVLCTCDGRAVIHHGQIAGEEFYWMHVREREAGSVDQLVHDEEAQEFRTPDTGEVAVCRDFIHLERLFRFLGP